MADITMCTGEGCAKKDSCYRFTAVVNRYRQAYFCKPPVCDGACDSYCPNTDEHNPSKPPHPAPK